ncbi:hypothetical protein H6F89_22775 [Cyanobacteria bacterium FACHB-63]|nr:hypothetical protein [Cyanobacteria bacterium FACHB-63]
MGIFNSRSLSKLNRIRNKVEHEYSAPNIDDLEIYFELVNGFIHTIESCIFMLSIYGDEMKWLPHDISMCNIVLKVDYSFLNPSINYDFMFDYDGEGIFFGDFDEDHKLTFSPTEKDDFLFAMRTFFLLCRATALINHEYVIKELNKVV